MNPINRKAKLLIASVVAFLFLLAGHAQAQIINPTIVDNISVGLSPEGIGVNPATSRIYVANYSSNTVSVINTATDTVIATISVGNTPGGVGVNSTTNRVYVANYSSNTVSVIDGSSNSVMTTISVGNGPDRLAVDAVSNRVYVSNQNDNTVSVVDGSSNLVIATVTVGTTPLGVAVNPTTSRVYVANYSSHTVSVIDGTTNLVTATIPGFDSADYGGSPVLGPTGVGVNPVTNRIYVVGYGYKAPVWVVDGTTNSVITTIIPGGYYDNRGVGVGTDPTTNFVYVAYRAGDGSGGSFVSINGANNTVAGELFVCCLGAPHEVGVNPLTNRVYVSLPGWCCYPSTAHWVSVIANAPGDFSLSPVSPITVSTGGSVSTTVTVNSISGFSSPVNLSVSPPTAGVSASFATNPVTPSGGGSASSALDVSVGPSVTPSIFTLTVTGSSGSLTHSAPVSVTVTADTSGITNVIGNLLNAGCIDNSGIGTALTSKLVEAQAAISAGNIQTAINILTALKSQLQAQAGKHIATSCTIGGVTFNPVTVLLMDVQGLINSLRTTITPDPITGYVVNSIGVGVSGATVSIVGPGGNTVATATTDITGFYFFPTTGVLALGASYTVKVTGFPSGFTTSASAFQTFMWSGSGIVLSNFALN